MDSQNFLNIAFGVASSVLGWFAREMWSAVKELKSDFSKLREELPKEYVARDDYRSDIRELKEMLSKIFDKMDNKVDK